MTSCQQVLCPCGYSILKVGDNANISGPYGEFLARETGNEMVFVGGSAVMASMRSHIFDQFMQLDSSRKIVFWYGARSLRDTFYADHFDILQEKHKNFQ